MEVRWVVRPEQFFTEHVSGITVPATFDRGGTLTRRWLVHVRWADGRREVHTPEPCIEVPGGGTIHVDPVPAPPRDGIPTGWSMGGRAAWLAGAADPDRPRSWTGS